uniref:AAA domain-containing protein n=1 Tax=Ganoderma boninense TaxID=34458 RepID=A0A5K1K8R4_9APHY|nr:AAA domain-containing protein [Ganoderma boninense]
MFEPVRGGTRGGQAEFKWSDVSQDKDREVWFRTTFIPEKVPAHQDFFPKNYLGHSINAPTGRWQKNKDIHWYQRDGPLGDEERREEIRQVKEAEAEALAAALGFAPGAKSAAGSSGGAGTGANAIAVPVKTDDSLDPEKEERRLRKAQKKEEKRLKKEEKRARRHRVREDEPNDYEDNRRRRRSRSHSPRRRDGWGGAPSKSVKNSTATMARGQSWL